MIGTLVTLNGTTSSSAVPELEVVYVKRQLLGERRDVFVDVAGKPGSYAFAEEPGDRYVRIGFDIAGATFEDRRDAVRRFAEFADTPSGPVPLAFDDEPGRYSEAVLVSGLDVEEWLVRGSGELEYRVGPYSLDDTATTQTLLLSGSPDSDSWAAADEIIAYPIIELTPTNGTLLSFSLEMNGDILTWAGLVLGDNTLTISSISATVTSGANVDVNLTGTFNVTDLEMSDVDGVFPLIVPGSNTLALTWTGTATNITVDVTWRRRYR